MSYILQSVYVYVTFAHITPLLIKFWGLPKGGSCPLITFDRVTCPLLKIDKRREAYLYYQLIPLIHTTHIISFVDLMGPNIILLTQNRVNAVCYSLCDYL